MTRADALRVEFSTDQVYEMEFGADYAASYRPAAFSIVPYQPSHLRSLALQPSQAHLGAFLVGSSLPEDIVAGGPCWTAMAGPVPVACGGFRIEWPGRSVCWAAISAEAGPHMLAITRAVRRGLAEHPAERIETTVQEGFSAGMRWIRMLGFEDEGLRRRYCRGEDHRAFALLKPQDGVGNLSKTTL